MNELGWQSLVVKAVRERGGYAFKLSNKFLVGIPDLLVKLPTYEASLWEVKLNRQALPTSVALHLTPKQLKALRDFTRSNGTAGVVSFLTTPQGTSYVAASTRFFLEMPATEYRTMSRGQREDVIVRTLTQELDR